MAPPVFASVDSLLVHPYLGAMHLFDGGPLFNGFVEIAAADLKHRQPMPKHTFILSKSFCVVPNATVYDRPVDPLHRFDPLRGTEQAEAAGACGKTFLCCCDRLVGVLDVLVDGGEQQIPSQPERIGPHHIFEGRDGLSPSRRATASNMISIAASMASVEESGTMRSSTPFIVRNRVASSIRIPSSNMRSRNSSAR